MNRTNTRLLSVGGILVLGACAIALAQHDSRRGRDPINDIRSSAEPAKPIATSSYDWQRPILPNDSDTDTHSETRVVRANNGSNSAAGSLTDLPPNAANSSDLAYENPLRSGDASTGGLPQLPSTSSHQTIGDGEIAERSISDRSSLSASFANHEQAGTGRVEAELAAGQTGLPKAPWLSDIPSTAPPASSGLPSTASTSGADASALPALPTGPTALQAPSLPNSLPSIPSTAGDMNADSQPSDLTAGNSSNGSLTAPVVGSAEIQQPPSRSISDLSDTQRPVMSPTDLTVPSLPSGAAPTGLSEPPVDPQPSAAGMQPTSSLTAAFPQQNSAPPPAAGSGGSIGQVPSIPSGQAYSYPAPEQPTRPTTDRSFTDTRSSPLATTATTAGSSPSSSYQPQTGPTSRLVSNRPGNRYLDGSQNPVLEINKRGPEEIQVGKPATFVITVQNSGNSPAHDVSVVDSVPRGARFVESAPAAQPGPDGILNWKLGELGAGERKTVTMKVIPEVQGEMGSVAAVYFAAQASLRTVATLPKLELELQTPPDVLIGNSQQIMVAIRNSGTGVARGVRLEADIPAQLRHESGDSQLEARIGDLRPNETKRLTLSVAAVQPGKSICAVRAISEDDLSAEQSAAVEVLAPKLTASIEGPKLRYLERQATYKISVKNIGTAAGTKLEFQLHLPTGLKFNAADVHGHYDPNTHTVSWGLHELPAGQAAPVEVTVLPVELGPQVMSFVANGDLGISAEAKSQVTVDGLSELAFSIGQDDGTIEVGSTSTYSVQVSNVGNKPDRNVQLAVELPQGAQLVSVLNAPVKYQASGNNILFAPVPEIRHKDQYTYRFQVRHTQPGNQILRTKLVSSNWPEPVVKEEGTLVYNDQN